MRTDFVGAEAAVASLYRRFVFLWCPRGAVVGNELWTVRANNVGGEKTINGENELSLGICTIRLGLFTVHIVRYRNNRPDSGRLSAVNSGRRRIRSVSSGH